MNQDRRVIPPFLKKTLQHPLSLMGEKAQGFSSFPSDLANELLEQKALNWYNKVSYCVCFGCEWSICSLIRNALPDRVYEGYEKCAQGTIWNFRQN